MNTVSKECAHKLISEYKGKTFNTNAWALNYISSHNSLQDNVLTIAYYASKRGYCEYKYTLVHDFKSGMSLDEAKRLTPLTLDDLKDSTPLDGDHNTIVFNGFVVNTLTTCSSGKWVNFGYLQDNINIATGGFRECAIKPLLINHTLDDGIYRIDIAGHMAHLVRYIGGLAQGNSIIVNRITGKLASTMLFHNGLILTHNTGSTCEIMNNRRKIKYSTPDSEENFYEGKKHGVYKYPSLEATFEHGALIGKVTRKNNGIQMVMTLRKPMIPPTASLRTVDDWFGGIINENYAIGQVTWREIKSNKLISSVGIDSKGFRHGKRIINGVRDLGDGKKKVDDVITWYWHNKKVTQAEFIERYQSYVTAVSNASGLLNELSDMVIQYLH